MMHLKMNKLKYTIKTALFLVMSLGFIPFCVAQKTTTKNSIVLVQDTIPSTKATDKTDTLNTANAEMVVHTNVANGGSLAATTKKNQDSIPFERFKIDGVAAVIGERLILDSDVQKMYKDLESRGISTADITDCELAERLMKNKLYAHQAIQDSLVVDDQQIRISTDRQIDYFVQQAGSMEKVLKFYNIKTEAQLRNKLFEINKEQQLAQKMQAKIIEEVTITPEEVREFFSEIPEDKRPKFGDEVEIAQIIIKPEPTQSEIDKTIARLNKFRDEILAGESSFATKAVLYSDDPGSSSNGGQLGVPLTRDSRFVQEFKDAAFSMEEGEISKPFKTKFGYHILRVDEIRGQEIYVRHILLVPKLTDEVIKKAQNEIDSIRASIVNEEISFFDAARKFSDEEETRGDGGKLINPETGTTQFVEAKVDPSIYNQVVALEENQVSGVLTDSDRTGNVFFKIITVTNRFPAHIANYEQDFAKIKELALTEKKLDVIAQWQEEKIKDTYVKVNGKYRDCDFTENWLKK